jgi:hypothetical protein
VLHKTYTLDFVMCLQLLSWVNYLSCLGDCSEPGGGRYDKNRSSFICVGVGSWQGSSSCMRGYSGC